MEIPSFGEATLAQPTEAAADIRVEGATETTSAEAMLAPPLSSNTWPEELLRTPPPPPLPETSLRTLLLPPGFQSEGEVREETPWRTLMDTAGARVPLLPPGFEDEPAWQDERGRRREDGNDRWKSEAACPAQPEDGDEHHSSQPEPGSRLVSHINAMYAAMWELGDDAPMAAVVEALPRYRPDYVLDADWRVLAWKRLINTHSRDFFRALVSERSLDAASARDAWLTLREAGKAMVREGAASWGLQLGPYGCLAPPTPPACAAVGARKRALELPTAEPPKRQRTARVGWLDGSLDEAALEAVLSGGDLPLLEARMDELQRRSAERAEASAMVAASMAALQAAQAGMAAQAAVEAALLERLRAAAARAGWEEEES